MARWKQQTFLGVMPSCPCVALGKFIAHVSAHGALRSTIQGFTSKAVFCNSTRANNETQMEAAYALAHCISSAKRKAIHPHMGGTCD